MMRRRSVLALGLGLVFAACGAQSQDGEELSDATEMKSATDVALECAPQADVPGRASPYDSTMIASGALQAKVCYSRPFTKGRTIFGSADDALVPYGRLWRTGANEPTTIHLAGAATIAGLSVEAGSYSIYSVPGEAEWTIIVNRATSQWGHEGQYTAEVEAQEVGRATVPAESLTDAVEQFTIRTEPTGGDGADLVLEWANARVRIPVVAASM